MTSRTLSRPLCSWLFIACVCGLPAALVNAQVQTGPINEPLAQQKPAPAVPKGAAAITRRHSKCSTELIVNADALFVPHRWTLNPDAVETLDVLGPMIAKAGKHPARIVAYTAAADSNSENRDVSERRALTVKTWLVNHQFLPAATPIEALSPENSHIPPAVLRSVARQKNGIVEVAVDSCH